MPRPPRIDFANALYHVTCRGNGRARIFLTDADRLRFLRQLRDNVQTAAVRLYAFVLMDNHFHLLVRTPRANLSRFMQRLNTGYALYARYKHRRPGHQFEARFKAKLVQDDTYLLALTRYIHLNPVKVAACRKLSRSERVRLLDSYRWSSYPGYVDGKAAMDFVAYDALALYDASDVRSARRQYRAYTQACLLEDDRPIAEALQASRYAIGDERFARDTSRRLARRRTGRPQDADVALPAQGVALEEIDARVAARFRVGPEDLRQHGHHAKTAKFVAVEVACRLSGLTQRAIGAHYGGITSAAVSIIRRKIREGRYRVAKAAAELVAEVTIAGDRS
jgi:REP element-mobilizing transposase RayT